MLIKEERGVSIILIAILFPVLLFFFAVALDVGSLLLTKRQLQAAADAGALAGASCFEVYGEMAGADPAPAIRITPSAGDEADHAIQLNSINFSFASRGILIVQNSHSGVGTDTYLVELTAEAPTLLVGAVQSFFQEGGSGRVTVHVVSEVKVSF